jgi:hypothetical protein
MSRDGAPRRCSSRRRSTATMTPTKLTELRASFPALYEALTAHEPWPHTEPGTFDKPLAAPPGVS